MKYNYSAGPAKIASSVITKANESIIHYEDSGMSILEISHRSNEYKKIMEELKINLTSLLNIPDDYFILLLQGGATYQNTFLPHNYGVDNILYSVDGGANWDVKDGNLPDLPVLAIQRNPYVLDEVIVGTDLGVWKTTNFSAVSPNWTQSNKAYFTHNRESRKSK